MMFENFWRKKEKPYGGYSGFGGGAAGLVVAGSAAMSVTGGNSTQTFTQDGTDYKAHIFIDNSTDLVIEGSPGDIDIMVIGGGGGGGSGSQPGRGAGGGAGALIYESGYNIAVGTYDITIGAGGAGGLQNPPTGGASSPGSPGTVGGNTSVGSIFIALGGGFGASNYNDAGGTGGSGGGGAGNSSGASGAHNPAGSTFPPGASVHGTIGGAGGGSHGGGGGGAVQAGGGPGAPGAPDRAVGSDGGDGKPVGIIPAPTVPAPEGGYYYWAGGGGGQGSSPDGVGGKGGAAGGQVGGDGDYGYNPAQPDPNCPFPRAGDNTGSGGGGASSSANRGSQGGSGIVIIRYTV